MRKYKHTYLENLDKITKLQKNSIEKNLNNVFKNLKVKQEQKVLQTSAPRVNFMFPNKNLKISIKVTKNSEIVSNSLK